MTHPDAHVGVSCGSGSRTGSFLWTNPGFWRARIDGQGSYLRFRKPSHLPSPHGIDSGQRLCLDPPTKPFPGDEDPCEKMKIVNESFTKGGSGSVKLIPDNAEDMWQLFNLLRVDDHCEAVTFRKVTRGGVGAGGDSGGGGSCESERIKVKLKVLVTSVTYDGDGEAIRVKGRNTTETEHVKLGAYHTLDIDTRRPVTVTKSLWDTIDVDRLRYASSPTANADVAVLLITEGLANIFLVGASVVSHQQKVEKQMPRKTGAAGLGYDKALSTFHKNVLSAVLTKVDLEKIKCLVVAGPGFAKETFLSWCDLESQRFGSSSASGNVSGGTSTTTTTTTTSQASSKPDQTLGTFAKHRKKIVQTHCSSAFRGALKEVLETTTVAREIGNTKAASEIKALDVFFETLSSKPDRALYGPAHVFAANELGAVETLLIQDGMFRNPDANQRRRWVALTEEVATAGGTVFVFSSAHESGRQLGEITGIAATLRFPLPDLVDAELPPIEGLDGLAVDANEA